MISARDYQLVVCNIEAANINLHLAIVELISMQSRLASMSVSDARRKPLKSALEAVGLKLQDKANRIDNPVLAFVQVLQKHVQKYYGDVNIFLSANSIKIPTYFAFISKQVGFEIQPANLGTPLC